MSALNMRRRPPRDGTVRVILRRRCRGVAPAEVMSSNTRERAIAEQEADDHAESDERASSVDSKNAPAPTGAPTLGARQQRRQAVRSAIKGQPVKAAGAGAVNKKGNSKINSDSILAEAMFDFTQKINREKKKSEGARGLCPPRPPATRSFTSLYSTH